jgi:PAS domain S-box-containing protein
MSTFWNDLSEEIRNLSIKETTYAFVVSFLMLIVLLMGLATYSAAQQRLYRERLDVSARAALYIAQVNALIYAVVMESRGVYMSADQASATPFAEALLKRNREILSVVADWQKIVSHDDAPQFAVFKNRIDQFLEFRTELVRRTRTIGPSAGRDWGDNDANRTVRTALNEDLEALAKVYADRAREVAELGEHGALVSWYLVAAGIAAMALAVFVALAIARSIVNPVQDITRVTNRIAGGKIRIEIPHLRRADEIGQLARAVQNFQDAVFQIRELETAREALASERDGVARERDSIEDKLLARKWQLDAAMNNMAQGLIMLDRSGAVLLVNDKYRQMYRLPADVVRAGCSLKDVVTHRAKVGLFSGDIDAYVGTILARIVERKPAVHEIELADERVVRVSECAMDGGGWVATHEDITVQRRTRRTLERTEQFLAAVLENVPEAIVAKKAGDLRYVFANHAAEVLYGLSRSEMMGKTAHEIFPGPTADLIERHDRQLLAENRAISAGVHTIETPGHGARVVSVKRLPIAGKDGESHFLLSLIEDITDRTSAAA